MQKSTVQKAHQSKVLKDRFKTPEGEVTRRQISDAAKRLQASEYGFKAAEHLRKMNNSFESKEATSIRSREAWAVMGIGLV
jgi:hypothetical protein